MKTEITIVDRGRGPQLSTCRITVQDLLPFFQRHCTYEEIMRWIPVLSVEEIKAVERYVQDNDEEVMKQDRRIRERNAQRKNPPEIEEIIRQGKLKRTVLQEEFRKKKQQQERNGDHSSC